VPMRCGRRKVSHRAGTRTIGTGRPRMWKPKTATRLRCTASVSRRVESRQIHATWRHSGEKKPHRNGLVAIRDWHTCCRLGRQVRAFALSAAADPGRDCRISSGPHSRTSTFCRLAGRQVSGIRAGTWRLKNSSGAEMPTAVALPVKQRQSLIPGMRDQNGKALAGTGRCGSFGPGQFFSRGATRGSLG